MRPIPNLVDESTRPLDRLDAHTFPLRAEGFLSNTRRSYSEPCRVSRPNSHVVAHLPDNSWRVLQLLEFVNLLYRTAGEYVRVARHFPEFLQRRFEHSNFALKPVAYLNKCI